MATRPGPRARAAILLVLVGALGVLIGIGIERLRAAPQAAGVEAPATMPPGVAPPGARMPGPHAPDRMPHRHFGDRLADDLDLTDAQRAQIDSIMAENRTRVRALMREYRPRFRAIVEETRRGVDEVLTDEQRARLRELRAERRRE